MEKKKQIAVTFVLKEGMKLYCKNVKQTYIISKIFDNNIIKLNIIFNINNIERKSMKSFSITTEQLIEFILSGKYYITNQKIKVSNKDSDKPLYKDSDKPLYKDSDKPLYKDSVKPLYKDSKEKKYYHIKDASLEDLNNYIDNHGNVTWKEFFDRRNNQINNKQRPIEQIPEEMINKLPKVSLEEMKSNIEFYRKSLKGSNCEFSKIIKPSEIRLSRDEWFLKLKNCWFEDIKNINSSNDFKGFM